MEDMKIEIEVRLLASLLSGIDNLRVEVDSRIEKEWTELQEAKNAAIKASGLVRVNIDPHKRTYKMPSIAEAIQEQRGIISVATGRVNELLSVEQLVSGEEEKV